MNTDTYVPAHPLNGVFKLNHPNGLFADYVYVRRPRIGFRCHPTDPNVPPPDAVCEGSCWLDVNEIETWIKVVDRVSVFPSGWCRMVDSMSPFTTFLNTPELRKSN